MLLLSIKLFLPIKKKDAVTLKGEEYERKYREEVYDWFLNDIPHLCQVLI